MASLKVVSTEPVGEWLVRPYIVAHMLEKDLIELAEDVWVIKDFFTFWKEMKTLSKEEMEYYL